MTMIGETEGGLRFAVTIPIGSVILPAFLNLETHPPSIERVRWESP